jgi:hypothetical protein
MLLTRDEGISGRHLVGRRLQLRGRKVGRVDLEDRDVGLLEVAAPDHGRRERLGHRQAGDLHRRVDAHARLEGEVTDVAGVAGGESEVRLWIAERPVPLGRILVVTERHPEQLVHGPVPERLPVVGVGVDHVGRRSVRTNDTAGDTRVTDRVSADGLCARAGKGPAARARPMATAQNSREGTGRRTRRVNE